MTGSRRLGSPLMERPGWAVAGLLLLFFLLALTGTARKSATFDEVAHLPAGYSYLALGDFRMNPEHPPLAKLLAATPLLALKPALHEDDPRWRNGLEWPFGQAFLFDWNDPDRLIFWGRMPLLLLATLFGLVVYFAAREFFGAPAGLLALALYVLTPEFLAHGALVTTDVPVAAGIFCAVYGCYRALLAPSLARVFVFASATGVCLVSKFSGLLVLPMLLLLGGFYLACPTGTVLAAGLPSGAVIAETRGVRLGRLLILGAAATGASLLLIWACYGFRFSMTPNPSLSQLIPWGRFAAEQTVTRVVLALRDLHLFPETYLYGFLDCLRSLEWRPAFLLGEHSTSGWWYYYPLSFLLKTPVPLLLLLIAAGCGLGIRRWAPVESLWLVLPVLVYLAVSLPSRTNIGNRHILPIYPFLIVYAAQVAGVFGAERRGLRTLVVLLLLWLALGTARIHPHYLAYFNELSGGPARGSRYLADSNLDWGQDLNGLARYRDQHPEEPFYVSYFGAADPRYYLRGVVYLPGFFPVRGGTTAGFDEVPSGALVAISATNLAGVYVREYPRAEAFLRHVRALEPEARIGYSILVYRLP